MTQTKHLLLWSSLGALALLGYAALKENFLSPWRQIQQSARAESGPLDVRLRQVVVPGLHATDRCVTCHVGMGAGEQGVVGPPVVAPHKPVVHDPAEFGCCVCHGGQGRATEKAEAHGDVPFWPEPMIPARYAYAGCGACHTHLRVPNQARLAEGRSLLERYDCLACHRIDGRGGTLRPDRGGMEGPDLSRVGAAGFDRQWYTKHLEQHQKAGGGPWKTSFDKLQPPEVDAIEVFLSSRVAAPGLVEAKALFHTLGCRGCHKAGGVGGDDGPDLTLIGQRDPGRLDFTHVPGEPTLANWLAEHFRNPARVVPDSKMPALGLSEAEIDRLTFYMLSLRRSNVPEAYWPKDRIRAERLGEREFATDGATLFGTFCAACHGPSGEGRRYPGMAPFPAIGNRDFLAVATDHFLKETISRGRPGRRMVPWGTTEGGLRSEEIEQVISHLRRLGGGPEPTAIAPSARRWVEASPERGGDLYVRHCAGCHGQRGEGTEAPALNNAVLLSAAGDTYLVETIGRGRRGTSMHGFRQATSIQPALSAAEIESLVAFIRKWEERSK